MPEKHAYYLGGSPVWIESMGSVPVDNGVFSVLVGNPDLDTVAFNQAMDLGIKVDTDPEISPRTPLVTNAFALWTIVQAQQARLEELEARPDLRSTVITPRKPT